MIHVPTAHSLANGESWLLWSNYSEGTKGARKTHNIHLAIGLLYGLTVAGRISGANYDPGSSSDLSLHLHYKVPFIPRRWFDLALGIQDFGGSVSYYKSRYIVASRSFGPLNLTLGWGKGSKFERRGHGLMASLTWRPLSFLVVGSEWDGDFLNAALRMQTPPRWLGGRWKLGAQTAFTRLTKKPDIYVSGYLQMSLASSPAQKLARARPLRSPRGSYLKGRFRWTKTPRARSTRQVQNHPPIAESVIHRIHRELTALDLERIRIAETNKALRICVENGVFERSSVDALGVVLGIAAKSLEQNRRIELTVTKNALPLISVTTKSHAFAKMIDGAPTYPGLVRAQSGQLSPCPREKLVSPKPFGRPRLSLTPALAMTVATEHGYLDLHLGARWGLDLPLAYGSVFRVRYEHGIWNSADFAQHRPFHPYRIQPGFQELALHQALPIAKGLMGLLSVGLFDINRWTAATHFRFQRGIHSISAFGSAFTLDFKYTYWSGLGQYRIEWPGGPVALAVTGGQFPDQSLGLRARFDFSWGDTILSGYFRYGEAMTAGVGLSVPLAPRKNRIFKMGRARVLLSSTPQFSQSLQTRVGDWHNRFVDQYWLDLRSAYPVMDELYTEGGRLTESRAALSQERMRDAYHRYARPAIPNNPAPTRSKPPVKPVH